MATVQAPWTAEQVERLNEWQNCEWTHEFTCPLHADDQHRETSTFVIPSDGPAYSVDGGKLVARLDGWHCLVCGYHQTWAHDFMFHGAPPKPFPRVIP